MTRMVCHLDPGNPPCPVGPGDRTCPTHLIALVPAQDPAERAEPATGDGGRPAAGAGDPPSAADGAGRTPSGAADGGAEGAGGQVGPDPDRVTCWRCQHNLPDPVPPQCPRCQAGQPGPALALIFDGGAITLERGESTRLGRSRETPHARILSARNISHLHAVVWVDDDGTAWIKDTNSTNGTFVNGNETTPEQPYQLTGGHLRLGAGNRARIHLRGSDR